MSAESLQERAERTAAAIGLGTGRDEAFAVVPIGDLDTASSVAPADFVWERLVPTEVVTLFAAHGGTGKSYLSLMLCVAVAVGLPLFGLATRRCKVAFFSGEDGASMLRYRVQFLCRQMGVKASDLEGRLLILDGTDGDPRLYVEAAGRRGGDLTPTFLRLRDLMVSEEIGLIVLDNASDTFDANEISRAQVRTFMRALTGLARECKAGCVLLSHVDKSTSRGDRGANPEGYTGSTAWHNSARSRLFMRREADGGLVLEHQKSNLSAGLMQPLRLVWPKDGIPVLDGAVEPMVQAIADSANTKALLRLIHEYSSRGEMIAAAETSPSNAYKKLVHEPNFPKRLKRSELWVLLREAERKKYLCRSTIRTQDRKHREVWEVTPAGKEVSGIAPSAPSAPTVDVDADGAGGAPSAPTSRGVWGESAHASSLRDGTDDAHFPPKSKPAEEPLDGCSDALCDTSAHDYRDDSAAALACPSA